jgi:hypothetical protein
VIVASALIAASAVYCQSRVPVHGSYLRDLFPGLVDMSLERGAVFVEGKTAANAGVPADKAGLAAALVSASPQLGPLLGLAIFSAIATSRMDRLLAGHAARPDAHLRIPPRPRRVQLLPARGRCARPASHHSPVRGSAPVLGAVPDPATS